MAIAASLLVATGSGIFLVLGVLHLLYTFRGRWLQPRDPDLMRRMSEVPLVLTRQTTMWRAWVGFNASHALGAILFGLVYGYLALTDGARLFHSVFLALVGLLFLLAFALLGKLYWFSTPFRGIVVAVVLFAAGILISRL